VLSWQEVSSDEIAGILILNRPALEVSAGWYFVPLGIAKMGRFPRSAQQNQFPAEPEEISKMPDDQELRTFMVKPIRIPTAGKNKADSVEIFDAQLTLEPTITVMWQIEQKGFFEFYINMPGKTWIEKYTFLVRILRDTAEKRLRIEIGKRTPAQIYSQQDQIDADILTALSLATSRWGICIDEVNVLGTEPDHATNIALGLIPAARARSQATGTDAEAAKNRIIVESEGQRQATINAADADAHRTRVMGIANADAEELQLAAIGKGTKTAADAAGVDASEWRAGDVASKLGEKGNLFLGDSGIATAVGIAKTILKKGG
jgi:regulator of protease activity HflC (stomatin/prohibitin superfamily)